MSTASTATLRAARNFVAATAVAVIATSAVAYASGASIAPAPTAPATNGAHGNDGPPSPAPPRFLPVIGPHGKPVVDANGKQLIMDTAPESGRANPHGKTVIATTPPSPSSAAAAGGDDSVAIAPRVVRPYDDTKYHEK